MKPVSEGKKFLVVKLKPKRGFRSEPALQFGTQTLRRLAKQSKARPRGDRNLARGELESRFAQLVTRWKKERGHESSIERMAMNEAYQQIIGLGPQVVPLLLREMELRPSHWDWALRAITGKNPVPAAFRGRIKEMARIWVEWGKKRSKLS